MDAGRTIVLDRRQAVAEIVAARGDALIVSGLGAPTWDVAAAGDSPRNFYLWGAMGGAAMIGLGLAHAQPARQVLVITGDGELLMGLGSLATIAVAHPPNLSIVVIDNESYGETGMQPSHTARGVDLAGVARAAGFASATTIHTREDLAARIPAMYAGAGPTIAVVKVTDADVPARFPPRDGTHIKNRFREAVLGPKAFL